MSKNLKNAKCIDFHSHIYPHIKIRDQISDPVLQKIKSTSKYYSLISHAVQQKIHLIPEKIRKTFDPLLLSFTLPTLAINSTLEDLKQEILSNGLTCSVVASHLPNISNEFILNAAAQNSELIPCLTYAETENMLFEVANLEDPQFLLKLNPMAADFDLQSENLQKILNLWNKKSWPLLIHTGALYSSFFKNPELGQIENLTELVKKYSAIQFILLHMNIFKPFEALEFCAKFENTAVTTSWQSEELITVACKKIGSERILFSSDWPLLGNNIEIRKKMILELNQKNYLTDGETENILFNNAKKILETYFSKKL
jgi:hypothetical protein